MEDVSAFEWVTLGIAAFGAVTGLLAIAAQLWSHITSGPRIKVSLGNSLWTADATWTVGLDVTNVGRLPVEILEVGLLLGEAKGNKAPIHAQNRAFWQGTELPYRLEDGSQVGWHIEPAALALTAMERGWKPTALGYARLATGKTVYSRSRVNLVSLAQSNSSGT